MTDTQYTSTAEKQATKHTPEAVALADSILKAAGSSLRHYSMAKTREAILSSAQKGLDDARSDLLTALQFTRDWFADNELEQDHYAICDHLNEAIAKAKGHAV